MQCPALSAVPAARQLPVVSDGSEGASCPEGEPLLKQAVERAIHKYHSSIGPLLTQLESQMGRIHTRFHLLPLSAIVVPSAASPPSRTVILLVQRIERPSANLLQVRAAYQELLVSSGPASPRPAGVIAASRGLSSPSLLLSPAAADVPISKVASWTQGGNFAPSLSLVSTFQITAQASDVCQVQTARPADARTPHVPLPIQVSGSNLSPPSRSTSRSAS